ncbi:MAG: hypothetical protein ACRDN9_07265 [Streptosporangiaceae bacterium]
MARRVFFHIGVPKSGTTFLQDVLWRNRQRLADQGILLPCQRRDHLHSTLVIREHPHIDRRLPSAPGAWDRIVDQTKNWPGTVIISHEFFGAAAPEQAKRAIDDLAPAEVHIVVTARDYVRQLPGAWQERLKYRSTDRFCDFIADDSEGGPLTGLGWRTYDISGVLGRWAIDLPPERVHVVTVPQKSASPGVLWERFAGLCGIDPDSCDLSAASPNQSLGVAQAELLRRVNFKIAPPIRGPRELAPWIRDFLAHRILAGRPGQRFGLPQEVTPALRERARRAADGVSAAGYDVVGDLAELIPPEDQPKFPQPDAVTDAELLEVATQAIADMLHEYRAQTLRAGRQKRRADEAERALADARARPVGSPAVAGRVRQALVDLSERQPVVMKARVRYRRTIDAARRRRKRRT